MVGDAAANAAIAWLSRDSFVPILFQTIETTSRKNDPAKVWSAESQTSWSPRWRQQQAAKSSMVARLETRLAVGKLDSGQR